MNEAEAQKFINSCKTSQEFMEKLGRLLKTYSVCLISIGEHGFRIQLRKNDDADDDLRRWCATGKTAAEAVCKALKIPRNNRKSCKTKMCCE